MQNTFTGWNANPIKSPSNYHEWTVMKLNSNLFLLIATTFPKIWNKNKIGIRTGYILHNWRRHNSFNLTNLFQLDKFISGNPPLNNNTTAFYDIHYAQSKMTSSLFESASTGLENSANTKNRQVNTTPNYAPLSEPASEITNNYIAYPYCK